MTQRCRDEFRSLDAYVSREVGPGALVRPWIGVGPYFHDLSEEVGGRSFFEDLESDTGEDAFRRCLAEGEACLPGRPVEGHDLTYLGETLTYEVIDNEEPLLNWGRYFRGNTLVAKLVSTRVWPDEPGCARFGMLVRIDNQIVVSVNDEVQFRSFDQAFVRTNRSWLGEQTFEFELDLSEGENVITIGAFRLGRIAGGSLFLRTLNRSLTVEAALAASPGDRARVEIEAARDLLYPAREWFYPEDPSQLLSQSTPHRLDAQIECAVVSKGIVVAEETVPASTEVITLCKGADVASSTFQIRTTALVDGNRLEPRLFECTCVKPMDFPMETVSSYDDRRQVALAHFAKERDVWAQVARHMLGRAGEIDRAVIGDGCEQIDCRLDCADFILHPFLRMIHRDRGQNELPADILQQMTESCLNFRYWTDEPGSDCLVTGTENHQILFHTAEIIAGHLWPEETFTNNGMTGLEHVEHGRVLAERWCLDRTKTGFREWHSSSYYPHWMSALLDLYDCVPEEESRLREMAAGVLAAGCLNLATDSFEGSLVTTHGRIYAPMLKIPDTDGCSGVHWLLYGEGHLGRPTAVVPMAAGGFRPPSFFADIAADQERVTTTRHHQGNDSRFIVHRTPDYLMCALQDYKPGQKAAQVHPFQLTFRDKTALFFSCPETSNEGSGHRPDYWSGNGFLPRVFGERNVAVLLFEVPSWHRSG